MAEPNIQVASIWPDVGDSTVLAANQFLVQVSAGPAGADWVILTVGHAAPPVILGTPEEQIAAAHALNAVEVKTLGRFAISPQRLGELVAVLNRTLQLLAAAAPPAIEEGRQP